MPTRIVHDILGDPDFVQVPVGQITSKPYAVTLAKEDRS